MKDKIVKANRTESIAPYSAQPRRVLVTRNYSPDLGPFFQSWICEHAGPQKATGEEQVILCNSCYGALNAGADIEKESE
jgi:hypothetical protein